MPDSVTERSYLRKKKFSRLAQLVLSSSPNLTRLHGFAASSAVRDELGLGFLD
jgi:hypothetical protein